MSAVVASLSNSPPPPPPLSHSRSTSPSSSTSSVMDSRHHRLSLSMPVEFRSPHYRSDPLELLDANNIHISPRTLPLSFRNLSVHEKGTPPLSSPSRGYCNFPFQSASTNSHKPPSPRSDNNNHSNNSHNNNTDPMSPIRDSYGYFSQGAAQGPTPRRHHRRGSIEFSLANPPTGQFSSAINSMVEYHQQIYAPHIPAKEVVANNTHENLYSSNNSSTASIENMFQYSIFNGLGHDLGGNLGAGTGCGAEVCRRHHHRQSISSTVSITCSDRGDDDRSSSAADSEEDLRNRLDRLEAELEASLAGEQPASPVMLVPLNERAEEMKELLRHPSNRPWTKLVRIAVGADVYDNECVPLWTRVERYQMADSEWLARTKQLLAKAGPMAEGRLWKEFCGMVGWDDSGACPAEPISPVQPHSLRRSSRESLQSNSSGKMSSIAEELEEEEAAEVTAASHPSRYSRRV